MWPELTAQKTHSKNLGRTQSPVGITSVYISTTYHGNVTTVNVGTLPLLLLPLFTCTIFFHAATLLFLLFPLLTDLSFKRLLQIWSGPPKKSPNEESFADCRLKTFYKPNALPVNQPVVSKYSLRFNGHFLGETWLAGVYLRKG